MNEFGGDWTENKIDIIVEYAKAYLKIMHKYADFYNWKLLYFDGFAGSGYIIKGNDENQKIIIGAAKRILEIEEPRPFDIFYFVEKDDLKATHLEENTKRVYNNKFVHIVKEDCNDKIKSMSQFLTTPKGKKYKVLAYIDPCGMQLNWDSLQTLQKLSVDVWILVPTGMGVNRLLKKDSNISDAWVSRLEVFLGMDKQEILDYFYKKTTNNTLFGEETIVSKNNKAIEKSAILYKERLSSLFSFVTQPYILKNKTNSAMFHFFMASNNKTAAKIANEIIEKYNKIQ